MEMLSRIRKFCQVSDKDSFSVLRSLYFYFTITLHLSLCLSCFLSFYVIFQLSFGFKYYSLPVITKFLSPFVSCYKKSVYIRVLTASIRLKYSCTLIIHTLYYFADIINAYIVARLRNSRYLTFCLSLNNANIGYVSCSVMLTI